MKRTICFKSGPRVANLVYVGSRASRNVHMWWIDPDTPLKEINMHVSSWRSLVAQSTRRLISESSSMIMVAVKSPD